MKRSEINPCIHCTEEDEATYRLLCNEYPLAVE